MRIRRKKCKYSVYHIIVRGNNRQAIFLNDTDRVAYLERLKRYMLRYNFHIYAYCLMTNHIHLLVYDNGRDISKFMQGLNLSYTIYFNKTYDFCGHLFQDRFKSIIVKNDIQFLQVAKYIHLNPVKAYMVDSPELYRWSSYNFYIGQPDPFKIVNTYVLLRYFSPTKRLRVQGFLDYMNLDAVEDSDFILKLADTFNYINIDRRPKNPNLNIPSLLLSFCKQFKVSKFDLLLRYNRNQKDTKSLALFTLAYGNESEYKELAKIFHICPSTVGRHIHHAVKLMINNPSLLNQIESILF